MSDAAPDSNPSKKASTPRRKRKRVSKATTTKRLLWAVFIWVVICTQESFLLAYLNREPATSITIAWITTGLGTFGIYLVRAYLEKKNLPPEDDTTGGP